MSSRRAIRRLMSGAQALYSLDRRPNEMSLGGHPERKVLFSRVLAPIVRNERFARSCFRLMQLGYKAPMIEPRIEVSSIDMPKRTMLVSNLVSQCIA